MNSFINSVLNKTLEVSSTYDSNVNKGKLRAVLTKDGEVMWHRFLIEEDKEKSEFYSNIFFHVYCIKKDIEVKWKSSFLTSDNPFILFSLIPSRPNGVGLLSEWVDLIMPLAHDVLVVVRGSNYGGQCAINAVHDISYLATSDDLITKEKIEMFNLIIARSSKEMVFSFDCNFSLVEMISREKKKS